MIYKSFQTPLFPGEASALATASLWPAKKVGTFLDKAAEFGTNALDDFVYSKYSKVTERQPNQEVWWSWVPLPKKWDSREVPNWFGKANGMLQWQCWSQYPARLASGWPNAVAVLSRMRQSHVQVDVLHKNAILSSFSDVTTSVTADWRHAIAWLQIGATSDTRSYNIARSHVARWTVAICLLEKQKQQGGDWWTLGASKSFRLKLWKLWPRNSL